MKIYIVIFLYYLLENIKTAKIYQCGRYRRMPNQCLNQWVDTYGNVKVDLWKCPMNFYCHVIPKKYDEENFNGVCAYNYKKLYDGDTCSMDSECSSLNCTNSKCVGFSIGEFCRPNFFQCANNLTCKIDKEILPYGEIKQVYKCNKLSQANETCDNSNECDIKLICGNYSIYNIINLINSNNISNISEISNKIDFENYISTKNNNTKICIERATLDNGLPTSDPMLCKSGDSIDIEIFPNYTESICASKKEVIKDCDDNNTCIIKANLGKFNETEYEQNCLYSTRGNLFCPLNQKEQAWNEYLENYQNFYETELIINQKIEEMHFPVYKDTFNNFLISQYFWKYKEWQYNIEADSCTKEFFFLINKGEIIKYYYLFNLIITFLIMLF